MPRTGLDMWQKHSRVSAGNPHCCCSGQQPHYVTTRSLLCATGTPYRNFINSIPVLSSTLNLSFMTNPIISATLLFRLSQWKCAVCSVWCLWLSCCFVYLSLEELAVEREQHYYQWSNSNIYIVSTSNTTLDICGWMDGWMSGCGLMQSSSRCVNRDNLPWCPRYGSRVLPWSWWSRATACNAAWWRPSAPAPLAWAPWGPLRPSSGTCHSAGWASCEPSSAPPPGMSWDGVEERGAQWEGLIWSHCILSSLMMYVQWTRNMFSNWEF